MQYIIRAYDGENMLNKRMEVRPSHLENMAKVNGKIICAGGLLDEDGKMKGSVLIMEFDDRFGLDQYLAVTEILKKYEVPIVMDLDIGHIPPQMPLISGAMADVAVSGQKLDIRMRLE